MIVVVIGHPGRRNFYGTERSESVKWGGGERRISMVFERKGREKREERRECYCYLFPKRKQFYLLFIGSVWV